MLRSDTTMLQRIYFLMLAAVAVWAPMLEAGEFTINPLRVSLDRSIRASEVVVRNDDTAPLRMQVEAMTWRQDAEGKDQYEPADGLLYFPRAMELAPGESRIVRVGVKAAPVTQEDSYRLFIEELPLATPANAEAQGTSLRVFLRVGVAVFVAPAKVNRSGEIRDLAMRSGAVEWAVANTGNVHFRTDRVELVGVARDGTRLFAQEFPERYFLPGVVKKLRFDIPRDACARLAVLEASVVADNLDLRRKLDVDPGSCR
jgi:fimbrial chaperone protein